ncbi:MAG: alpha/beta hydrolase [Bacteroidota bacterium]
MNKLIIAIFSFLIATNLFAQNVISGSWNGILEIQGMQLRLVFHIIETDNGFVSTMDSPDQGAKGIPVTSTIFESPTLKLQVSNARIEYIGEFSGNQITGIFKQAGKELPLSLARENAKKEAVTLKPQEPIPPLSYYTENINFKNEKTNFTLAGTLSLPSEEGKYPVVILISGSGPQNRDGEIMVHKPFLVIANYLTENGIGVLRYDERGVGESEGDFRSATFKDFASDVSSAVNYLKTRSGIDFEKIGLIGHSEGGLVAPMVVSKSNDIAFMVLLAAPGVCGDRLLLKQQEMIAKASGVSEQEFEKSKEINAKIFEMVQNCGEDIEALRSDLKKYFEDNLKNAPKSKPEEMSIDQLVSLQVNQITNSWMMHFLKYDPALALQRVKCPVLALNGEKDLQVSSRENLKAIKKSLKKGKNRNVTTEELEGLNHLFQECTTGLPNEYSKLDQTISPVALEKVFTWIKGLL